MKTLFLSTLLASAGAAWNSHGHTDAWRTHVDTRTDLLAASAHAHPAMTNPYAAGDRLNQQRGGSLHHSLNVLRAKNHRVCSHIVCDHDVDPVQHECVNALPGSSTRSTMTLCNSEGEANRAEQFGLDGGFSSIKVRHVCKDGSALGSVAKREHACLETVCVLGHYCAVDPQTKHCVCVERSPYLETPEGQAEAAVKAAAEAAVKAEEKAEKAAAEAESKAEERAQKHAAETHAKALEVAAKHAAEASAKILERKTKSDAEASAKSEASSKALALKAAVKANAAEAAAKSAERSSKAAAVAMFGDSRRRYVAPVFGDSRRRYVAPVFSDSRRRYVAPVFGDSRRRYVAPVFGDSRRRYVAPVFGDSRRRYVAPVFGDSRRRYVAPVKTKSSGGGTGAPSNGGGCRRLMEASAGLRRRLIDAKKVWGSKGIHHASGTQMMCRRLREQMCTPNGAWAGTPACE